MSQKPVMGKRPMEPSSWVGGIPMTNTGRLDRGVVVHPAAGSTASIARINSGILIGTSILEHVPQSIFAATDPRIFCEPRCPS